jgi:ABC-type amino acid transport substrate-binding protein
MQLQARLSFGVKSRQLILRSGTPKKDRLGFVLQNGSELRQALDTGLDLIQNNGSYQAIYTKWFPAPYTKFVVK